MGHMSPTFDMGFSFLGMIIPFIMLIVWLAVLGLSIYIMILLIKALKIYINKNS